MDTNAAKRIVRETFQNSFDKERFTKFIKELFNKIEVATFVYRGNTVPQAYQPFIHTLERLGKYTDAEGNRLDILIVRLKKVKSIEHARTMQRNFVAWYLNGSRGGELKDAAVVAFYTDESEDWRFSLIKMDYQLGKDDKGKSKVTKELTPAKRFSFLVGKNENSHTAQKQLLPILADDQNNPLLSDLETAFNIEIVTKEFFNKYRELFLEVKEALDKVLETDFKIKQEFSSKAVETADFAKKLLGQIVFLYFLQKKGWFGVERDSEWGTGPKDFLRRLYVKRYCEYKNFFNDVLEPLFYNALAVERQDDWSDRFNCKIPFLNGGLFDPLRNYDWVHTDIELPNELFSNEVKDLKTGDIGTGILDIFDRYNFTVKEDEPLEKEVAVDPEMLGKVFENLLEVKDRKSKGTYYTPREIVHYMCQQSLINYLATEFENSIPKEEIEQLVKYGELIAENEAQVEKLGKETETYYHQLSKNIYHSAADIDYKLANIKVCDPAIGSGAFPVGMMSEIVKARNVLSNYLLAPHAEQMAAYQESRTIYSFKRDCIQNSLYGVDIDPGAVEIAKLRLWLSLIVDEEDIKDIKPLPNLDYKIMQGNSLLEEFEGIKLFDEKLLESPIIDARIFQPDNQKIISLQGELLKFYMKNPEWMNNKEAVKPLEVVNMETQLRAILKEKKRLPNNSSIEQKDLFASVAESKQIRDELENLHKKFFEETNKRTKEELKRKIENLEWDLIEASLEENKKTSELKKLEQLKQTNTKPFFLWKLNFAEVFQQKGGFDVLIANPPYIGEKGHKESFREIKNSDFLGKFYLGKMDFFYFFFHLALNLGNVNSQIAFITTDYYPTALGAKKLREDFRNRTIIRRLINFNDLRIFESAMGQHNMVTILSKGQNDQIMAKTAITKQAGIANSKILSEIVSWQDNETEYFDVKQKDLFDGDEYYIRLSGASSNNSDPIQILLNKIKLQGALLGTICNVNNGVFAGADKLSADKKSKYKINDASTGEGIFILTNQEVKDNGFSNDETKIIKPLFKNSDIKKFYTNTKNELNLINLRYTDRPDLNAYPKIKKHLKRFEKLLTDRPRTGTLESAFNNGYWYVMSTSRKLNFDGPKIVFPQRSNTNTFGYNEVTWYAMSDVFFITQKGDYKNIDLKYILALLNSKLYYLWLYHRGKRKGEILELIGNPVSEIPIKIVGENIQKQFNEIVDIILVITKSDDYLNNAAKKAKVHDLEEQIDKMVYKLYGLTGEEIKIVGNF
ncbi:MAG: TaqI-like C-terminal specificity domain-containing protein [Candidatus Doudnabacteria bacterium]|nr:TaqI-like C-terminal specificity domain-containing protein [Candidatus Doudnabacteria bacterium]